MQAPAHPLAFVARQKKALRQGFAAASYVSRQKRTLRQGLPQRLSTHQSRTLSVIRVDERDWDRPENRDASLRRTTAANRAAEGRRCTSARRRNGHKRRCHSGAEASTRPGSSRVRPAGRCTREPYEDVLV